LPQESKSKKCSYCNLEYSFKFKYCTECGKSLSLKLICPECKSELNQNAIFCPECGFKVNNVNNVSKVNATIQTHKNREAKSKKSSSARMLSPKLRCPVCKKDDNVRKISVVLDEGTSSSQTFGLNIPINNHRKHQNDAFSVSTFSTTTKSALVSRLQPPDRPLQKWSHFKLINFMPYFFGVFIIVLSSSSNNFAGAGEILLTSIVGGLFYGGIIFIIVSFIKQQFVPPSEEQKKWQKNLSKYRNSFYCFRDDICFNEELHETPYRFRVELFY
jgi:hypothetical protein